MAAQEHIAEQLKVLLCEDLKVISYKWLARKFGLPCNVAKQTLFAFLEQHRGKVKATYLLAGWTTTEPRQHTVQLVDAEHLSTRRSSLGPVTSMHVYSLQPTQPKDASELWNHDAIQTAELFQELRLGQTNCMADNRWSAIKCLEAKHDPSLAKRAPKPAAAGPLKDAQGAGPSKPAQKPAANTAAGQIAGIMAGSARQGGVATASVAVKGSGSSSIQGNDEAVPMERDSGTTATAPAGAPPLTGPSSGPATSAAVGGKKKGGKSRLANMWSKAPAAKEKAQQPGKSKALPAAVDADAALRCAQQAGSSSDSEEEDVLPMKRTAQQRSKRIDEEEDDEDESPVRSAGRQAKKAKTADTGRASTSARRRQAALQDSEDEDDKAGAAEPAKVKASAKPKSKAVAVTNKKGAGAGKRADAKKASQTKQKRQAEFDEDMSEVDIEVSLEDEGQEAEGNADAAEEGQGKSQAGKGKKGAKRTAANKPGSVKAGDAAGPKRRKVMRTTINDRGEEVTEQAWEDSQEEASASQQQDSQPDAASGNGGPAANSPAGNSPVGKGPSGSSPEKLPQDDALKEQPGNGVAAAGKPTSAKPSKLAKPAAPAAKRSSSKATVKDQRGIMSFFAKK